MRYWQGRCDCPTTHPDTALVLADPKTAFQYLATQQLPQYATDLNPIWQGFYGTRPAGRIADKESEYYLYVVPR